MIILKLIFDRFLRTTGSEVCQTDILGIANDFHTYRIGILKASRGNNNQKWFRLFALKEDKSGWYYFKGVKNAHLRLTLHTKAKKNKKYNKGFVVLDNDCWTRLSEIIESSVIVKTIKIEKYGDEGFYDEEEAKVAKTIGSLRIVD